MDESQIKALYRQHAQTHDTVLDDQATDDITMMLSQHGWPAEEHGPLDRVAASATASDIARLVAALGPDIETLAQDVRQLQAPRRTTMQRFVRRGFALAAGIGAFAVLFSLLPGPQQAPGAIDDPLRDPGSVIMAVSFESAEIGSAKRPERGNGESIFRGNFDS